MLITVLPLVWALAALQPSLVVIHRDSFPEEHWLRPFHRPSVRLLMIRLWRNNQNPQLQSFLRASGLSAFPSSICDQPSVVIISEQGRLEVVTEEMQQRFDRSIVWNPFYMASFRVWQCLPAMSTRMTLVFERTGEHAWEMHTPQCDVPETGEPEDATIIEINLTNAPDAGVTHSMARLSVGLEDPDDLIADLDQALKQL